MCTLKKETRFLLYITNLKMRADTIKTGQNVHNWGFTRTKENAESIFNYRNIVKWVYIDSSDNIVKIELKHTSWKGKREYLINCKTVKRNNLSIMCVEAHITLRNHDSIIIKEYLDFDKQRIFYKMYINNVLFEKAKKIYENSKSTQTPLL